MKRREQAKLHALDEDQSEVQRGEHDDENHEVLQSNVKFASLKEQPLFYGVLCAAKDETSVEFMRPLLNSWAECSVAISCGKVDYDKSGSEAINARCGDYV
jgi:hypothetical protein